MFKTFVEFSDQTYMRPHFTLGTLIATVVFALSQTTALADDKALASKSDFDIFVEKLGGEIPFPPNKIVERLGSANHPLFSSIFPHGRSLERESTDFAYPRSVFVWAPTTQSGAIPPDVTGQPDVMVFLGYTPKKEQLELISFNSSTKKFEFRVVKNYAQGKKAEVVEPPRSACTACHQGGIPIFPDLPWSETQNDPTVKARLQNEAKEPFAKYLLHANEASFSSKSVQNDPYRIDNIVVAAKKRVALSQDCASACLNDIECKRNILATFVFLGFSKSIPPGSSKKYFSNRKIYLKFPDNRLADRVLQPAQETNIALPPDPDNPSDFNGRFRQDPLQPSPQIANEWTAFGLCFSSDLQLHTKTPASLQAAEELLKRLSYSEILDLLNSSTATNYLSKNWPIDTDKALTLMGQYVRPDRKPNVLSDCNNPNGATLPLSGETKSTITQILDKTPLKEDPLPPKYLALRYCAQCHYGTGSLAPTLPLDDLHGLINYNSPTRRGNTTAPIVKSFLEEHLMPPMGADQPTEEERAALIKAMMDAK